MRIQACGAARLSVCPPAEEALAGGVRVAGGGAQGHRERGGLAPAAAPTPPRWKEGRVLGVNLRSLPGSEISRILLG